MKKSTGPTKIGVMGRWSIFRPKVVDVAHRYQGWVTDIGRGKFEEARDSLADLFRSIFGRPSPPVSDADTIEYLARGKTDTIRYLRALKKEESETDK